MTIDEQRRKIKAIRQDQDIIPVLKNALNYKDGHELLFLAAIEEITELRATLISLASKLAKA